MYAGHLGFALGAYSFRRTLPLWLLLLASQIPDWLDAGACIADVDRGGRYGLYTHGWIPIGIAAIVCGIVALLLTRDAAGALLVALVEVSHYPLDYFTGRKPTWPGGPVIGLDLYRIPMADLALEGAVIVVGWLLYRRTLPDDVRNDGMTFATLFALLAFQVVAGVAFLLSIGGRVKC